MIVTQTAGNPGTVGATSQQLTRNGVLIYSSATNGIFAVVTGTGVLMTSAEAAT